jgi:hypothetical protein
VIKDGTVIDGSVCVRFPAGVGVWHGRIVAIGRIRERAREIIGEPTGALPRQLVRGGSRGARRMAARTDARSPAR